jgi:hypothetical protein
MYYSYILKASLYVILSVEAYSVVRRRGCHIVCVSISLDIRSALIKNIILYFEYICVTSSLFGDAVSN